MSGLRNLVSSQLGIYKFCYKIIPSSGSVAMYQLNPITMKKTLILGYGNPDRGDDGAAWVALSALACHFGHPIDGEQIETGFIPINYSLQLWLNLQLMPELAEDLAKFDRAVFVDAHTEDIQGGCARGGSAAALPEQPLHPPPHPGFLPVLVQGTVRQMPALHPRLHARL